MFLSRSLFAVSLAFCSSVFIVPPVLAAELDKCHYESPNNILTPSGDITKDDICNTPYMDSYENLNYYAGPKAFCGDNKAAYCAKVEKIFKDNQQGMVTRDYHPMPLEKQYWYRALNYCGMDANAAHNQYCETYAKEGGWNGVYGFELNCKPADVSAFADRQCAGREYTSGNSSSDSAFCARNYKGKLDPRFKKLATKESKPQYSPFHKNGWKACKPILRPEDVKKGSPKLAVDAPASSGSSSGSSSTNTTSSPSGSTPPAPSAPSGVDDALNKAKKIKDLFNF